MSGYRQVIVIERLQTDIKNNMSMLLPVACNRSDIFHNLYAVWIRGYRNPSNSKPWFLYKILQLCCRDIISSIPSLKFQQ